MKYCRNTGREKFVPVVVKEGSMAPSPKWAILPSLEAKWGYTALHGGLYSPILAQWGHITLQEGYMAPNLPH